MRAFKTSFYQLVDLSDVLKTRRYVPFCGNLVQKEVKSDTWGTGRGFPLILHVFLTNHENNFLSQLAFPSKLCRGDIYINLMLGSQAWITGRVNRGKAD